MSDITRFIKAQERTHASALRELKNGYKASHWSWWEIPQIIGLGMTSTSREYAIKDMEEAKEYLGNDTLRMHLLELCDALLSLDTNDAEYVMGYPDGFGKRIRIAGRFRLYWISFSVESRMRKRCGY